MQPDPFFKFLKRMMKRRRSLLKDHNSRRSAHVTLTALMPNTFLKQTSLLIWALNWHHLAEKKNYMNV